MPIGERGPYSASSVRPATIVGSANGRSMIAFITALPRKSSRRRTHAVIVPSTALTSATTSDATSVSFSAAAAPGAVTASQKPCQPSSPDAATSAAIGSTTMIVRKVVTKPRDRAVPTLSPETRAEGARRAASLASDAADLSLDRRHDALVRIEEVLHHLLPPAEAEVGDGEHVGPLGELLPVGLEDALHDRPVAVVGEHLLGGWRLQEPEELVRDVSGVARLEDRDRVLDQDRGLRDHVLDGL